MRGPRRPSPFQEHAELDALIAADARVRGDSGRVSGFEVTHHLVLEIALEVPHVVRERQGSSDAPRVIHRVDRAAAAIADGLPVSGPHRQRDTEGAQAGCGDARGRDTRIHPT